MNDFASVLGKTADEVFFNTLPVEHLGFDQEGWRSVSASGLHRILLPEALGGAGFTAFSEASTVALRFGAHSPNIPFIDGMVANWICAKAGIEFSDEPVRLVFGREIDGKAEGQTKYSWPGTMRILWPDNVRRLLIVDTDALYLCENVPGGAAGRTLSGDPAAAIESPLEVHATRIPPELSRLAFELYALLTTAAIVGSFETLLSMTIEYANVRAQFGRAIGKFQAIQHMIAEMSSETAAAAASLHNATHSFGTARGSWDVAIAKSFASEAVSYIVSRAHQVHGAIGYTAEFPLQRFTRRLWAWREEAGTRAYWHQMIGAAVLASEDQVWSMITEGAQLSETGLDLGFK